MIKHATHDLAWLNSLTADEAAKELLQCCGSKRWAAADGNRSSIPDARNPNRTQRTKSGGHSIATTGSKHFAVIPKIGEKKAADKVSAQSQQWSGQEQSGVANASQETVDSLAALNATYEQKFGFIFIICATGKTSDEMLSALRERLEHDSEAELPIAAAEQSKITELRLKKLLTST